MTARIPDETDEITEELILFPAEKGFDPPKMYETTLLRHSMKEGIDLLIGTDERYRRLCAAAMEEAKTLETLEEARKAFVTEYLMLCLSLDTQKGMHLDTLQAIQDSRALERDLLTGLYTRTACSIRFPEWFLRPLDRSTYGSEFVTLLIDVRNLNLINGRYGQVGGDELLRDISHTLLNSIRTHTTVPDLGVRWGGDEFLILSRQPHIPSSPKRPGQPPSVAMRLLDEVRRIQRKDKGRTKSGIQVELTRGEVAIGICSAFLPPHSPQYPRGETLEISGWYFAKGGLRRYHIREWPALLEQLRSKRKKRRRDEQIPEPFDTSYLLADHLMTLSKNQLRKGERGNE